MANGGGVTKSPPAAEEADPELAKYMNREYWEAR